MHTTNWTARLGFVVGLACLGSPDLAARQSRHAPLLATAAQEGDARHVQRLLDRAADVNAAHGDGMTALHWAVYNGDVAMARTLLKAGASVDSRTRLESLTPLHLACRSGNADLAQLLLEAGADANAIDGLGATPLMQAAAAGSDGAVRLLLDRKANPNAVEPVRGQTALMFAAAFNRESVIRLLAERGAAVDVVGKVTGIGKPQVDEDGNPIPASASSSRTGAGTIAAIAAGGAKAMGGFSALHYAVRDGHEAATRALVAAGADVNLATGADGSSPLVVAISNGHFDLARFILERGADPNIINNDGLAALYAVIDTQWAPATATPRPIVTQENITHLQLMKALLDRGVDPNVRLRRKLWFSPLHANSMWVGPAGATPFWRAAQATDLEAMKLLLAYGANPRSLSDGQDTALHMAAGVGWAGNFSVNAPDGFMPSVRYLVEEVGLDVNAADVRGYTPIMGAAFRGDNAMIDFLVAHGADLQARSGNGWVTTDFANGPSLRSSVPLSHPETIALLLKLGAPPLTKVDDEEILGIIRRKIPEKPQEPGKAKVGG
jgi:ankyrin repeat protein